MGGDVVQQVAFFKNRVKFVCMVGVELQHKSGQY